MAITGIFYVEIQVSDLPRAKRFYGETLSWKLNTDLPEVGGFWFGAGYLVAVAGKPAPGSTFVCVRVDDVEAEHKRLSDSGVAVTPIDQKPWGERSFRFSDPDGHLWVYGQG